MYSVTVTEFTVTCCDDDRHTKSLLKARVESEKGKIRRERDFLLFASDMTGQKEHT